jgi:hypothetical protein
MTLIMKNLIAITLLMAASSLQAMPVRHIPTEISIHERLFTFSSYYEMDSVEGPQGTLIKEKLAVRTGYQYYDPEGRLASCAYLRIFSLGSLYTWAGVLDVYESEGKRLGWIEGTLFTLLPSEFSIFNDKGVLVGRAYMDYDCMGFTISDPINEKKTIAHFRRKFIKEITDHWSIIIHDPAAIDYRLLYTFGAFVLDNQSDFRLDD